MLNIAYDIENFSS